MSYPRTFASLSGDVPAAYLDENFANAAEISVTAGLQSQISALPAATTPAVPTAAGTAGVAATLSRSDHAHPVQAATVNLQVGTTYTVQSSDNGKVVELSNSSAITVTVPNSLAADFNCSFCQVNTGQVTIAAGASATQRQASGYTKTRAQWSEVALRVRANVGGSAAEYVLSGDMAA